MTNMELTLWDSSQKEILPAGINTPAKIAEYAKQLSLRERKQIAQSFEAENYEVTINYVWNKAMAALKKESSPASLPSGADLRKSPARASPSRRGAAVTDREAIR